jgi:triosephosphate isomerase (TIM)
MKPFFAANWKMNKSPKDVAPFVSGLVARGVAPEKNDILIAPPATHLSELVKSAHGTSILPCAQNSGPAASGAFTGEISPQLLKELGVGHVLIGHSERRHVFHEDDGLLSRRLKAAWEAGLSVIYCIGETLAERRQGATRAVVERQLELLTGFAGNPESLTVAYEPVWAIGTGENASPEQAEEVHGWISQWLKKSLAVGTLRILYGGSVKADNAKSLMVKPHIDGLLIGGASLEVGSFADIIQHGRQGWDSKNS